MTATQERMSSEWRLRRTESGTKSLSGACSQSSATSSSTMARSTRNGYEFAEFVITATYWSAPEPDAEMKPWYGGPYPGWWPYQWTTRWQH